MERNKCFLSADSWRWKGIFFCLFLLLLFFAPQKAFAQSDASSPVTTEAGEGESAFGLLEGSGITVSQVFDSLNEGFTLKVIVSIKTVLESALLEMMSQVYAILLPAVVAFMVLVVVIFGLKLTTGAVRNPRAEIPVLFIKLALVYLFSTNMAGYVDGIFSATESLMAAVSESMVGSFWSCSPEKIGLDLDGVQALVPGANMEQYMVWQQLDCIFIRFLGFSAIGSAASIMIGTLVSTFFMGELGIYIMTTGMAAFSGFVFTILRVTYMYISSLLGLAFLLILAPLFIPLILTQATNPYFEKWLKICLAFLFQPVLLIAFVSLMVRVYDAALFTGPYSVASALNIDITSADEFDMGTVLEAIEHGCVFSGQTASSLAHNQGESQTSERGLTDILYSVFGEERGTGDETGIRDNVLCMQAEKFNPEKILPPEVTAAGTPLSRRLQAIFAMNDIILAFTALGIITMAMYTMLEIVDSMIRQLVERSFRIQFDYGVPFEKVATEGIKGFGNSMRAANRLDAQGNAVVDADGRPVKLFGVLGTYDMDATVGAMGRSAVTGLQRGLSAGLPFGGATVAALTGQLFETGDSSAPVPISDGSGGIVNVPRNIRTRGELENYLQSQGITPSEVELSGFWDEYADRAGIDPDLEEYEEEAIQTEEDGREG